MQRIFQMFALAMLCLMAPPLVAVGLAGLYELFGLINGPSDVQEILKPVLIGLPAIILGLVAAVSVHREVFDDDAPVLRLARRVPLAVARTVLAVTLFGAVSVFAAITGSLPYGGGMASQMVIMMWMPIVAVLTVLAEVSVGHLGVRTEPGRWVVAIAIGLLCAVPVSATVRG